MDIDDSAALLRAVIANETSKETLGFLWRNFAGFFKDPQDDVKFGTGIARFVHQRNMRYILRKWLQFDEMCTTSGIKHVYKVGGCGGLPLASCDKHQGHGRAQRVLCHKYKKQN